MFFQTTFGSFSVTQTDADRPAGMLTVSATTSRDLEQLIHRYIRNAVIAADTDATPCAFSIRAPQATIAAGMALAISDIYYTDFIDAVGQSEGDYRAKAYMGVADCLSYLRDEERGYDFKSFAAEGVRPSKIMELGAEGGSVTFWGYRHLGQRGYSVESNDGSLVMLGEADEPEHREEFFQEWQQAMKGLPEHWEQLYPLYVAKEFWPLITKELRARGIEATQSDSWLGAVENKEA
jgi:hypothetical protein